jgi:hypothetical protein
MGERRETEAEFTSPGVDFLSVSHLHDEDEQDLSPNLVNDAVVLPWTHVNAIELLLRLHLLHSMRTWIVLQAENVPGHLLSDMRIELAEVPLSGGSDFNAVGQVLVSKFPHQVPERNGPLLFGFLQGGPGVFDVYAVHFFPGQALQEAEVFYRNHSGQILPTAGDNGPLLPVGGAIYDFGKFLPRFRNIETRHRMYHSYKLYEYTTSIGHESPDLQGPKIPLKPYE